MAALPLESFRDYSLALYAEPEVENCCLKLQDRLGADVNMLLLCCWLAARGRDSLGEDVIRGILARTAPWRDQVVLPLRAVRRRLKGQPGAPFAGVTAALYKSVLAAELDAEHVVQLVMAAGFDDEVTAPSPRDGAGRAATNLARYLAAVELAPGPDEVANLQVLLDAAFPELGAEATATLISDALP